MGFSGDLPLVVALTATAFVAKTAGALEVQETQSHLGITVPEGWTLSTDGPWTLADAADHRARVRIAGHTRGSLSDLAAESYLVDFIAQLWSTYTVDRHVHHVSCGRFAGLELTGHGAGDTWDRGSFQLFLLVDSANLQKAAVVLISGKTEGWETIHPILERAVHASIDAATPSAVCASEPRRDPRLLPKG